MESQLTPIESSGISSLEERVLILAPLGREAFPVRKGLEEAGLQTEYCDSIETLCKELGAGVGVVLASDDALEGRGVECLVQALENQPPWSDLALIIFKRDLDSLQSGKDPYARFEHLGNVTFLERPARIPTLVSAVRAALRARRGQYKVRDLLLQKERAVQRLNLLSEVTTHLLLTDRPKEIVDSVFRKISAHLGLEIYLNYLYDKQTDQLRLNAYSGISPEMAQRRQWLAVGEAVCGTVAMSHQRIVVEDAHGNRSTESELIRSLGVSAYACFPLLASGHLIGVLSFGSRRRARFSEEELAIMETVCNQVAVAIERKGTEEELYELNEALERRVQERTAQLQETMDNMEAFSYSISHDLRAPLRVIRGFSQALLEDFGGSLDPVAADYLQRIAGGAERMDQLIQDLLAYSRLGRSKLSFDPIPLERALHNVVQQMQEEIRSKSAVIEVSPSLHRVFGHLPTLEQALTNLLSNALKFVPPGQPPVVTIWSVDHGDKIRLWIKDNGIGIAPQYHQRVFGVFERLHSTDVYPGTGIGLAIVAKAVSRMNGAAGVESAVGKGSSFWIELPKPPEPAPEQEQRTASASEPSDPLPEPEAQTQQQEEG